MSTSGTATWNPTVSDIVRQMYVKMGVIQEDEQPTAGMYADGVFALNGLTKALMMTGLHVWTEEEAILFLQPAQVLYRFGSGSSDHACDANSYVAPTVTTAAIAGANTLVLSSVAGISSLDNIGVTLSTGAVFWTTVFGAPSGSTVTLASVLPASVNTQANVFDYAPAAAIVRPLKVPFARRLYFQGQVPAGNETPLSVMSRQEYMDLPNKQNPGIVNQFFYSPQLVLGLFYVWNAPQDALSGVRFTWYRPLWDWFLPNNTADFPQEWIQPLIWLGAKELMTEFEVPQDKSAKITEQATFYLTAATDWDRESEPVQFGMTFEGR